MVEVKIKRVKDDPSRCPARMGSFAKTQHSTRWTVLWSSGRRETGDRWSVDRRPRGDSIAANRSNLGVVPTLKTMTARDMAWGASRRAGGMGSGPGKTRRRNKGEDEQEDVR